MSAYGVARDDFRNVRRSHVVLGVIGTFAALVALVFLSEIDIYDDAYRTLWDVSALIAFAFPLFVAPLTYLSIAGDRTSGSITFALGLPRTRLGYFLGKYGSRASVAVAAVVLSTLVGFVIAATTFTNGADPVRFATFAGTSALYALAISAAFVSVSAVSASRSRSMFAVIGGYFVLVPFWNGLLPFANLETLLDAVTSTLGVTLSGSTEALIAVLSPANAYFVATRTVYEGVLDEYETFATVTGQPDYLGYEPWFAVLVLLGWATVVPTIAYVRFRRAELG
jgi:ABC-2 type transport system permease protein